VRADDPFDLDNLVLAPEETAAIKRAAAARSKRASSKRQQDVHFCAGRGSVTLDGK
jgi:hypothetical protein